MEYQLLNQIRGPEDVKRVPAEQLPQLCTEIRDCLIQTVSKTGGHLASNLGVVELTVALHRSFSSPQDAILFDVGHQCYTHKLLTGRADRFSTLRQEGGLSGFMRPDESEHDPFITGHSSNAISAAYGIYKAKTLRGEGGTAVAVVGDGALTGGMAYEALNNAGSGKSNFIIVLNDNKMSISRNVGALARYLNLIRTRPSYHRFKLRLEHALGHVPLIGKQVRRSLFRSKTMLKNAIYHSNIFEGFGFNYLGPVDGHNIEKLENLFEIAREQNRPALIHVLTVKGKGYSFAENSPKHYHGVSPFDAEEGMDVDATKESFSSVAGETLCELAKDDPTVCAVTAAMTSGTGLPDFAATYKPRFFDVGIAEAHAVTFSAGLASAGMRPYFVVYSSFLQRGYDQVLHDAAIAHYPLTLCIDRAGIVGDDGETHQGVFDAAFLSTIPGMEIYSPTYYDELRHLLRTKKTLCAIRYPRGAQPTPPADFAPSDDAFTCFEREGKKAIVTYGRIVANALDAAQRLPDVTVVKLNRIHPLDEALCALLRDFSDVYFFEEGIRSGGIAEQLAALLYASGAGCRFHIYAIPDVFVPAMPVERALRRYRLDADSMVEILSGTSHG